MGNVFGTVGLTKQVLLTTHFLKHITYHLDGDVDPVLALVNIPVRISKEHSLLLLRNSLKKNELRRFGQSEVW